MLLLPTSGRATDQPSACTLAWPCCCFDKVAFVLVFVCRLTVQLCFRFDVCAEPVAPPLHPQYWYCRDRGLMLYGGSFCTAAGTSKLYITAHAVLFLYLLYMSL
jgi:hypothetical protein